MSYRGDRPASRKFDWEKAQRLREEGMTYSQIARRFKVSPETVAYAVDPARRAKKRKRVAEQAEGGKCDECGGPMNMLSRKQGARRCMKCAAKARMLPARVEGNKAWCYACERMLLISSFPPPKGGESRPFAYYCRACTNKRKKRWERRRKEDAHEQRRQALLRALEGNQS